MTKPVHPGLPTSQKHISTAYRLNKPKPYTSSQDAINNTHWEFCLKKKNQKKSETTMRGVQFLAAVNANPNHCKYMSNHPRPNPDTTNKLRHPSNTYPHQSTTAKNTHPHIINTINNLAPNSTKPIHRPHPHSGH